MLRKSIAPLLCALLVSGCIIVPANTTTTVTSSEAIATLPEPVNLRSQVSNVSTSITFTNATGIPLSVNWKDFNGKEVLYQNLAPGESYVQQTYETHPWVVRESNRNEPVRVVIATREPLAVVIQTTTVKRTTTTVTN